MANPQGAERELLEGATIELTDDEQLVLDALENARRPLDAIALATATSLSVEKTLQLIESLKKKKVVAVQPPEPIRERLQVDEDVLQRVG